MKPGKRLVFLVFCAALSVGIAGAQPVTFPLSGGVYTGECTAALDLLQTAYEISCTTDSYASVGWIQSVPPPDFEDVLFVLEGDEEGTSFSAVITAESLAENAAAHQRFPSHVEVDFQEFLSLLKAGNLYFEVTYDTLPGEAQVQIPPPPTNLFFAQFGNGDGLRSDIVLVNPATTGDPVTATVELLDPSGNPLDVGLEMLSLTSPPAQTNGNEVNLPPLSSATLRSSGQGELALGSAHVVADDRVNGVVRFSIPGFGVAGVGAGRALTAAVVPVRNEGSLRTAVAIRNTADAEITVNLTFRHAGDEAHSSVTIPVGGREAKFVDELFPELEGTDFSGSLTMEVDEGSFAAIALEQGDGVFTALPVTPVEIVQQ